MILQSLLGCGGDLNRFEKDLARRLRWWLLALPAGVGLATLRSVLKLWLGVPPSRSGVFSAGNGPAMRAAILGVMVEEDRLAEFVTASTRITHTDPKAKWGALAVALASKVASSGSRDGRQFLEKLERGLRDQAAGEFLELISRAVCSAENGQATEQFCSELGLQRGVSGYIYHTVPVAIQIWLRHAGDYRGAIQASIRCGKDTDTLAAVVGGIVGAETGPSGIPEEWLRGICDHPLSVRWMEKVAIAATSEAAAVPELPFGMILLRNAVFLSVVLAHGFRRLAPPY